MYVPSPHTLATGPLFTPVRLGALALPNRVLMAPMTRCRAGESEVPTEAMARYYAQRASAGLIVSEGSQVAPEGQGFPRTPGIHTDAQREGWRRVTGAVHAAGGRIVLQLWHVGRASHASYQPGGRAPVGPSAIAIEGGSVSLPDGTSVPYPVPRALEIEEIARVIEQFARAAGNARAAGCDGVELHGANGYLLEQFLYDGSNQRRDAYGGSVENRARLLLEVTRAVVEVWGPGRVGVRLSPRGVYNGMYDSNRRATYAHVARALDALPLAYLHLIDPVPGHRMLGPEALVGPDPVPAIRAHYRGPIVINGGYDSETANAAIASGRAAAVAFGLWFLANPDLPARLSRGAPLNALDRSSFYGAGERGYTDYPALDAAEPDAGGAQSTTRTS
jgi:N-ethylmaleimide reductase